MVSAADRELITYIKTLSEAALLRELPTLDRHALQVINLKLGIKDCDCVFVELPCGCDGPCECERDWAPCRHFKSMQLTWSCLVALNLLLNPDPEAPGAAARTTESRRMVSVMRKRKARKRHLYHPKDWLQIGANRRIQAIIARVVKRRRNGSDVAGNVEIEKSLKRP